KTRRCEARVGAVKEQITFLTCPFWISGLMSGPSEGKVAPPRVPFDTQVRPLAPCSASAPYRFIGMPTTAKPPKPIVEPSGTSRTASAKLGYTLDLGILSPRSLR